MKRMLMAIMAVAVLVAFSAPSFADETKGEGKKKKGKDAPKVVQMIYAGDEDQDKKDEKKDNVVVYGDTDKPDTKEGKKKGKK
jgi:uncharacterized membrane protein YdfJ with MMPL/SSD domain